MLVRLYFLTWVTLLLVAGVVWLVGALTTVTGIILGVIATTLVFSGLIGVLPSTFHHSVGTGNRV